jgi:GAF domain
MTQWSAHRSETGSVSAFMARESTFSAAPASAPSVPRSRGEDAGHSVAEMAQRDLDAALQLLADRAQYITGASGAAIALRGGGYNDMLCCASAGPNAPELGALLSAEFGLSGESVRTRLPLRCDDTERDSRVNREGCRRLGIASVAVMPIVSDNEVLGVFELFSGKVNAFEERDLSTLRRLGEMVETAVRLARTALFSPAEVIGEFVTEVSDMPAIDVLAETAAPPKAAERTTVATAKDASVAKAEPVSSEPSPKVAITKPLLWSAASHPAPKPQESDQSHVPPVLRSLRKCQACSFPVSEGRTLCVECEEKQWRGRLPGTEARASVVATPPAAAPVRTPETTGKSSSASADKTVSMRAVSTVAVQPPPQTVGTSALSLNPSRLMKEPVTLAPPPKRVETSANVLPFLSAGVVSSESWFSANKYILGTIAVAGVVLSVIAAALR